MNPGAPVPSTTNPPRIKQSNIVLTLRYRRFRFTPPPPPPPPRTRAARVEFPMLPCPMRDAL